MRMLSDTADHRCSVNEVLIAATNYHLHVEDVTSMSAHMDGFFTSVPDGHRLDELLPIGFFIGDAGPSKPKYGSYVSDIVILEPPLYS